MSVAVRPRVLVDVTQYVRAPATAGIQRVLWHLAEDCPGNAVDARFGFLEDSQYITGAIAELGVVIGSTFRSGRTGLSLASDLVRKPLCAVATEAIRVDDVANAFAGYFLPEPTYCEDSVAVATAIDGRIPSFFVYYDALPLTHPELFGRGFAEALGQYHRALVRSDNVAFISRATLDIFEQRLARRALVNGIVARPGADGLRSLTRRTPKRPTFTILGSVEPRKRHAVVLEAFERLWTDGHEYQLVVMGAPGWEQPDVIARLRALSQTSRVQWIERPSDDDVAQALARSSALVYVPQLEGYGLPPLEALAAGCPVIAPTDLPSFEELPPAGQIRLPTVTSEAVAAAVETLAAPEANEAYVRAISQLRLPTWKQFGERVEQWIAGVLATPSEPRSRQPSLA